jgi:hypothetical protein
MRFLAAISAALLFLFLAFSTPAFSQEDKDRAAQQEDKSKDKDKDKDKEQNKNDKNREQPRRDNPGAREAQPAQHDQERREQPRPDVRQENRDAQQQNRDRENRDRNNNAMRQEEQRQEQRPVQNADRDRDQHRGVGRRVERIPDDRFRASFGREHRFHVDRERVYSQPQPVVIYGGYSFQLVDAWPRDWSFDDDCYVDYDDGQYWLYDLNRPGMRIAVVVLEGY